MLQRKMVPQHFLVFFLISLFSVTAVGAGEFSGDILKSIPGLESASTLSQQKPSYYVVEFWASWCGPCHESAPFLAAQSKIWNQSKILWIGVNEDQSKEAGLEFLKTQDPLLKKAFVQLHDTDKKLAQSLGIDTLPRLYILDSNFKVLWSQRGFTAEKSKEIEKQFRTIFKKH